MNIPYKCLSEICKKYTLRLMVLFGSFNTEKFQRDSDIDLAVIADDFNIQDSSKTDILSELSSLFNYRDIDLIVLNHADALLKYMIAREGKLIYEKEKGSFEIFKVRAMSEQNDARKFYQLDKKYIENYIREGNNSGKQRVSPPQIK